MEGGIVMDAWQNQSELILKMLSNVGHTNDMSDPDMPQVLSCGGIYLGARKLLSSQLRRWRQLVTFPHLQITHAFKLRRTTPQKLFHQILQKESLN
jgi:hypothetical protein